MCALADVNLLRQQSVQRSEVAHVETGIVLRDTLSFEVQLANHVVERAHTRFGVLG